MLRWHLIPRNKYFNIYLHHMLHSDDDRALHDHPWWSISLCLAGTMEEVRSHPVSWAEVEQGMVIVRHAAIPHRLVLALGRDAWTLFVTGPVIREWGFHCPQGWRHWRDYTKPGAHGQIGRGCA